MRQAEHLFCLKGLIKSVVETLRTHSTTSVRQTTAKRFYRPTFILLIIRTELAAHVPVHLEEKRIYTQNG